MNNDLSPVIRWRSQIIPTEAVAQMTGLLLAWQATR